jgi:hypothetical protein
MQLLTSLIWPLIIYLAPALAVPTLAHVAWRGFPHLQKLFGTEGLTTTTRQLAWAHSGTSSLAIFVNIVLSIIFLGQVYWTAYRMVERTAHSYDYASYIAGILASGAVLGFAFYLAEWRVLLRQRDAKGMTI